MDWAAHLDTNKHAGQEVSSLINSRLYNVLYIRLFVQVRTVTPLGRSQMFILGL